jgi:DNA-binding transcriptional LysR family regulator
VAEAERLVAGEYSAPQGELVISAPIVFGRLHLLPVAIEFLKVHPQVNLRIALNDRMVHLLDNHIDIAVRVGELRDSSLVATRLGAIRHRVCASPGYLAAHGKPKRPADLARHACVAFDALGATNAWAFNEGGTSVVVPVSARLVVNTAEAAIDAAIAGAGVTRALSYQLESAIAAGLLIPVLSRFEPARIPVSLVYAAQRQLPLKLRAFVDFASARIRARLDELRQAIVARRKVTR